MRFVTYVPPESTKIKPLTSGECSIAKSGTCLRVKDDLAIVGVTDKVLVMVDKGTLRIGFRRPSEGDPNALDVKPRKSRSQINLAGVLRALSLEPFAAKGRYALTVKESDGVLILNLGDARS